MVEIYDRMTGCVVGSILTNHSMTDDQALDLLGVTVDDDGQLIDSNGDFLDAWYDNICWRCA